MVDIIKKGDFLSESSHYKVCGGKVMTNLPTKSC